MPLMGPGGFLVLRINNCRNWQSLDELISALERLQTKMHFHAIQGSSGSEQPVPGHSFGDFVRRKYRLNSLWDREYFYDAEPEGKLYFEICLPKIKPLFALPSIEGAAVSVNAMKYGNEFNTIRFGAISERNVESATISSYREQVMQVFVMIAQELIGQLSPSHVWIAEDSDYVVNISPRDVLARRLKVIYWANYFSSEFLTEGAKNIILESPVGFSKSFADGIWYQLHPHFDPVDHQEIKLIEDSTKAYFSSLGVTRIQWLFEKD